MSLQTMLIDAARRSRARIVLPEVQDKRVLSAAVRAQRDGIAQCVLTGGEKEVQQFARDCGVSLEIGEGGVSIVSPPVEEMGGELASLRGIDEDKALAWLRDDDLASAAMMVRAGHADGMVAGAANASASVLRAVLRIIGKAQGAALASSFFLMDMPKGAKVFADCALNVSPTSEQLAAIAVQSAESARRFGIEPVVAMLSYATCDSASGDDVERVRAAVELARGEMPDVPVIGPVQYDAAVNIEVGAVKMPGNEWAGRATVLIFPNLSSGNISYKAVQQSSGVVAVGPLMQGVAAAANDLSRGASEDDIYFTIAATAAQAARDD